MNIKKKSLKNLPVCYRCQERLLRISILNENVELDESDAPNQKWPEACQLLTFRLSKLPVPVDTLGLP